MYPEHWRDQRLLCRVVFVMGQLVWRFQWQQARRAGVVALRPAETGRWVRSFGRGWHFRRVLTDRQTPTEFRILRSVARLVVRRLDLLGGNTQPETGL